IGGVALAVLLELPEQVAEPAADHASRRAARKQAAQSAFENVAKTAAHSAAGRAGIGGRGCLRRARTGLVAEMLDRLPGEQRQDRHGHRRHSAAGLSARIARAARTLLNPVETVA